MGKSEIRPSEYLLLGERVSPDAHQNKETTIPHIVGYGDIRNRNGALLANIAPISASVSANTPRVRTNTWSEYLADYSDHRYGVHGSLRFFIRRWNRPRLVYESSLSAVREVSFKNDKGQVVKKNINLLTVFVGNDGRSDALKPRIWLALYPSKDTKEKWRTAVFSDFEGKSLPFRETEVKTTQDLESVNEEQLAYALVTNGLNHVDTLMKKTAMSFIIAFAFQGSKRFYFASENLAPMPLVGGTVRVSLSGHAKNMLPMLLSHNFNFILELTDWNHMSIVTTEEAF